MYMSDRCLWRLMLKCRFNAGPLLLPSQWQIDLEHVSVWHARESIGDFSASNDFERIVLKTLVMNLSPLFLEKFAEAREQVLRSAPAIPSVIVSSTGWGEREVFQILAGEAAERGSRLVAVQHGGGYGIYRSRVLEKHEILVSDRFLAWGWGRNASQLNAPSPQLSPLLRTADAKSNNAHKRRILLVTANARQYLYRFQPTPLGDQSNDYFAWQQRFIGSLSQGVQSELCVRLYRHDHGRCVRERLAAEFPRIGWDEEESISQSFQQSRLLVIDHLATTFLEALVADIPTVLFWSPHCWEVKEDVEPLFNRLRDVGILVHSPCAASQLINEIQNAPQNWWKQKDIQDVRTEFVENLALANEQWAECWSSILKRELELARSSSAIGEA